VLMVRCHRRRKAVRALVTNVTKASNLFIVILPLSVGGQCYFCNVTFAMLLLLCVSRLVQYYFYSHLDLNFFYLAIARLGTHIEQIVF
jgi:hypothetical protein